MKKTYLLLLLLILIMSGLVGLLVHRAHVNDIYFSEQIGNEAP